MKTTKTARQAACRGAFLHPAPPPHLGLLRWVHRSSQWIGPKSGRSESSANTEKRKILSRESMYHEFLNSQWNWGMYNF